MLQGELVDDRFRIERQVGVGGMASVYLAHDRLTGLKVAIKVWNGIGDNAGRFENEARVLAELQHPSIVRYVAHGRGPLGELYLAMQWLEGVDLHERLASGGLSVRDSVVVVSRALQALSVAHARGIVHRDLKPSNLFLVEGEASQLKVLDFGVARIREGARAPTRTGVLVGTPEYMSPEQARGESDVDARSDVFALGAVLFECLTGRPAFVADSLMALLAKILLEDAPRVRTLRPEVPEELDELVARMLEKSREARPSDAAALSRELEAMVDRLEGGAGRSGPPPATSLTRGEQRLISIVVVSEKASEKASEKMHDDLEGTAPTLAGAEHGPSTYRQRLGPVATAFNARLEPIAGGAVVLTLASGGAANDQAAHAARCAIAAHAAVPSASIALATGRGIVSTTSGAHGASAMGASVIDRAVALLSAQGSAHGSAHRSPGEGRDDAIRLDEMTAGLLDERFDVAPDGAAITLRGERDGGEGMRVLLGRPTPFVGRERELSLLLDLFDECVTESVSRVALVTAPAGAGKSRLRSEFACSVRARREATPIELWIGRGDPMRAGAPFTILAPALRRAAGIVEGEPLPTRAGKLRARIGRHVAEADVERVTEFLSELVMMPRPHEESSPQLRAARQSPTLMGDQVQRAFHDFLAAECSEKPVVLVLEDLHHGDLPTVKLLDGALRTLRDHRFMVLGCARPEVHQLFPKLWAERGRHEVHLAELTRRSSEKIVRAVLGATADDDAVSRLVERAGGNAFFLEELVRAHALGHGEGDPLPETMLAMVQSRLEALEPEARRVLRAASIFGELFSEAGVRALLGESNDGLVAAAFHNALGTSGENPPLSASSAWLVELVDREVITRLSERDDVPHQTRYAFRSAILRDAAHAMLTDGDRVLGHRLAASFLQSQGETNALVIADHLERGGRAAEAIDAYRQAAERARDASDFGAVIERAERAIRCGAEGEALGELRGLEAEAHNARGEHAAAEQRAEQALATLPRFGASWHLAAAELAVASGRLGHLERVLALVAEARDHPEPSDASATFLAARAALLARAAFSLFSLGEKERALQLLDVVDRLAGAAGGDPAIASRVHAARTTRALWSGDVAALLSLSEEAIERLSFAGDLRAACAHHVNLGFACIELGEFSRAEVHLREAITVGDRLGLRSISAAARHNLGWALFALGRDLDARALEEEAIALCHAHGDLRLEGGSRIYLAAILLRLGDVEGAEREARAAVEVASTNPDVRAQALSTIARVALARGDVDEAMHAASEAHRTLQALTTIDEGESMIRLTYAEALAAKGRHQEARTAIERAAERLLERAAAIHDESLRTSFLHAVPENARTLELAATATTKSSIFGPR